MKLVKNMALNYYPKLWSIERLKVLVKNKFLTPEEFKEVTGEEYTE